MGNYSLYAFEEEVRRGFLTLKGGHRVGLAGQAVLESQREGVRQVKTLKYISFLNVRIAHQKKGCAAGLLPFLCEDGKILPSYNFTAQVRKNHYFKGFNPDGFRWNSLYAGTDSRRCG